MECCRDINDAAYKGHLECVKDYYENKMAVLTYQVYDRACVSGHLEIAKYLDSIGCPNECSDTCYVTAMNGHFTILKYLVDTKYFDNHNHLEAVCAGAALGGHLHILKYFHEYGAKLNSEVFSNAAGSGYLPVVVYCHENNCPMNADIWQAACQSKQKNIYIIKYLFQIRTPMPDEYNQNAPLELLIHNKWWDAFQLLYQHGFKITENIQYELIKSCNIEQYEKYCKDYEINSKCLFTAIDSKSIEMVKYIHSKRHYDTANLSGDYYNMAVKSGIHMVQYLYSENIPKCDHDKLFQMNSKYARDQKELLWMKEYYGDGPCEVSCALGDVECLKFFIENNFKYDKNRCLDILSEKCRCVNCYNKNVCEIQPGKKKCMEYLSCL